MSNTESTYVSVTDTAKEIRKVLKLHFAGVKFSVRSKSYAGGASINVEWTDGPTEKAVEAQVKRYQGSTFDGMIDLKSYHHDYVSNEDGSVTKVHWGADHVFTRRNMSEEAGDKIARDLAAVAHESIYVGTGEIQNFSVEQLLNGHDLRLPVLVVTPDMSEGDEAYFASSIEQNYASRLIREAFYYCDLFTVKEAA